MNKGTLFLIPSTLGGENIAELFPPIIREIVCKTNYYIVENQKSARKFIKLICPEKNQSELKIFQLDKHQKSLGIDDFMQNIKQGHNIGLLSEAGLPAIADPGSLIVKWAHQNHIKVKPLIGPSSLMLALMSSGLNGQKFSFHGYLPKESGQLKKKIKQLERLSSTDGSAHLFIETPYRNPKLLDFLLKTLNPDSFLCIARDLTLPEEYIKTRRVKNWKKNLPDLYKKPTVFIFQAG